MTDISDAVKSVLGKSPVADDIIRRRYAHMVSESAASAAPKTAEEYDELIDSVIENRFDVTGTNAVRDLLSVILHLTDKIDHLEDRLIHATNESNDEQDDSNTSQKDSENEQQLNNFRELISGARVGDLKLYYNERFLRTIKNNETRFLLARELVEYAKSQDKTPLDVWSLTVQNNGAL